VRNDMPLRLLRSLVFGPMEHVLWDATLGNRHADIDTTALRLADVLWSALQPPNIDLAALAQFSQDVSDAVRRLERERAAQKPAPQPTHQPDSPAAPGD
jgi:uncharacterized protein (DUF1800 family)